MLIKIGRLGFRCSQCRYISYIHNVGKEPLKYMTIGQLLRKTVDNFGDRDAVISLQEGRRLKFYEILDEVDKLAAVLRKLGLQKGDRVGLWAPNIIEWYISKIAITKAGLITVALNPAYQASEVEYCINKVQMKALICTDTFKRQNYYNILNNIAPEIQDGNDTVRSKNLPSLERIIMVSKDTHRGTMNFKEALNMVTATDINELRKYESEIIPDDPCNIQFTSGTTGKPKAATVSHFSMVNNSYVVGKRIELDAKHHKICMMVPFFHAYGTIITLLAAVNHGATLVLPDAGFNPTASLKAIKNEKCTIINGTPTMYVDLINAQIKSKENICPEIAVSGGAPCSPHLFKNMLEHLKVKKVKSVYGLTETTAVVFHSLPSDDETKSVSTVGFIGDHIEAKVVDQENKVVPFGVPGELCVRGYMNMLGYWDDEAKTKEMIGPNNWLKTGDQFVIDADGYGKIVGRFKEMIIRGGENIFPKEIEDLLNTHDLILETHVIGIPHERLGEEVCACVKIRDGTNLTLADVKTFCQGKLAHFKIPSRLEIVKDFPKTASGKIQKFKLIEYASKL